MYPGVYAERHPDRPAIIMAGSGEVISFRDYEARCNRFAHYLRRQDLNIGDHYAMLLENHPRFLECCGAGQRAGLYYTCINSYLTGDEVAYIVNNSESKLLVTSASRLPAARAAMEQCPNVTCLMVVDEVDLQKNEVDFATAVGGFPETPILDERLGISDALFVGHNGPTQGHPAALAGSAAGRVNPSVYVLDEPLAKPRGYDLFVASAALSFRAKRGGRPGLTQRRHRHRDGAFRSRTLLAADRKI